MSLSANNCEDVAELSRVQIRSLVTSATGALDVTDGWSSLALIGADAERILNKVTAGLECYSTSIQK